MPTTQPILIKKVGWIVFFTFLVLAGFLFIYSPFYAKTGLWLLNKIPINVNDTAAQSQKEASLSTSQSFEPGSMMWYARQAYLNQIELILRQGQVEVELVQLNQRYQKLLHIIELQKKFEDAKHLSLSQNLPKDQIVATDTDQIDDNKMAERFQQITDDPSLILDNFQLFLSQKDESTALLQNNLSAKEYQSLLEELQDRGQSKSENIDHKHMLVNQPHAIVVLGGGLTSDDAGDNIVNSFTEKRLEKTLQLSPENLPIVLSGVEAPYMQDWLEDHGIKAELQEARSMNTCENTRFSSLLLQKQGGAPTVKLVTDAYHMPRARRLFAANGIYTVPIIAELPVKPTKYLPSKKNSMHTRRVNYEILAGLRDFWIGSNCREVPY